MTNKYAEGYPGTVIMAVVRSSISLSKLPSMSETTLGRYANVQPHSGAQANMAFYGCPQTGHTFMGLNLAHGGISLTVLCKLSGICTDLLLTGLRRIPVLSIMI